MICPRKKSEMKMLESTSVQDETVVTVILVGPVILKPGPVKINK